MWLIGTWDQSKENPRMLHIRGLLYSSLYFCLLGIFFNKKLKDIENARPEHKGWKSICQLIWPTKEGLMSEGGGIQRGECQPRRRTPECELWRHHHCLHHYVTLQGLPNVSVPQLSHLHNGDNNLHLSEGRIKWDKLSTVSGTWAVIKHELLFIDNN